MAERPNDQTPYGDLLDLLQVNCDPRNGDAPLIAIAIELRRVADALTGVQPTGDDRNVQEAKP